MGVGPAAGRRDRWLAACLVAACCAGCGWPAPRVVRAGLTFADVSFSAVALGPLAPDDLAAIEDTARRELDAAFAGLRITFADRRETRYRVAVVQQLRDPRFRTGMFVAGASRAITGLGGHGAVNFSLLASAALSCAPEGADRGALLEAIGRGVGRAAAHEFAHQLLPTAPIHDSTDVASYEHASAGRCQQYFGPMHWDLAGPLLRQRLGG